MIQKKRTKSAGDRPGRNTPDLVEAAEELRAVVTKLDGGFRKNLLTSIVLTYGIALEFVDSKEDWQNFIVKPFWADREEQKRPTEGGRNQALKWMLVFAFGDHTPQLYNRVSKYGVALERLFRKKRSAGVVQKKLKQVRGIDQLYDQERERRRKRKSVASNGHAETKPERAVSQLRLIIEIEREDQLKEATDLAVGEKAQVTYERVKGKGVRLLAKEIAVLDDGNFSEDWP